MMEYGRVDTAKTDSRLAECCLLCQQLATWQSELIVGYLSY